MKRRTALRLVTPLADGADRIAAQEALALLADDAGLRFHLVCPLPFRQEEYERDFDEASRHEFRRLLALGEKIELPGSRATADAANAAYEAVGRWVLDHCDVLLAIWNGQTPKGRGGSGQIVAEAAGRGLPTIWLHVPSTAEHASCILSWSSTGPRCGARPETLAV